MTDEDPRLVRPSDLLAKVQQDGGLRQLAGKIERKIQPAGTPNGKFRLGFVVSFDPVTWTCTALIGDQLTQVSGIPVLAGVVPYAECAGYFGQVGGDTSTEYTLIGMLAKGPGNIRIRKPADESTNNNATLQADDHLMFQGVAGRSYLFEILAVVLQNSVTNTLDFKLGWILPAGATWTGGGPGPISTIAAGTSLESSGAGANWRAGYSTNGSLPYGVEVSGTNGVDGPALSIQFHGSIKMGATSGTCSVAWAQNIAGSATTRVKEGSYLKVDMTSEYTL